MNTEHYRKVLKAKQKELLDVPWAAFNLSHQEEEDRAKSPGLCSRQLLY